MFPSRSDAYRNVELLQSDKLKANNGGKELDVRLICFSLMERLHGLSGGILHPLRSLDILAVFRPFDLVIMILFIAVFHGNALHPSFPHRCSGFFQGEPVSHGFIHLTV